MQGEGGAVTAELMRADQQAIRQFRNHGKHHADRAVVQQADAEIIAPEAAELVQVQAVGARVAAAVVFEQLTEQGIEKSAFHPAATRTSARRSPRRWHRRCGRLRHRQCSWFAARRRQRTAQRQRSAPRGSPPHTPHSMTLPSGFGSTSARSSAPASVTQSRGCGRPGRRAMRNRFVPRTQFQTGSSEG